ncbi:MAG TPA: FAD-binding oxidoreductase [Thermoanaerobaculia bacterium]|nr:FAD-binding oxidoreductase [Thermoanaerobaculia bacterium]
MSRGEATLSGWGRIAVPGREVCSEDLSSVAASRPLTRGLGRSYGDSSLPPPGRLEVAGATLADRVLAFDPESGLLRAEAGLSLAEVIRLFLPRGFWCPASPGTRFVTLGGMVAADVHGKSHHRDGTFGRHVRSLTLLLADGRVVSCSREVEPELFRATLGGMGLTGHILEVELLMQRLPSPWIECETARIDDLARFIEELRRAAREWPYTVGWIDCLARGQRLGRGILTRGRWAEPERAPRRLPRPKSLPAVPFELPGWVLSRPTVRLFNELYYRAHRRRPRRAVVDPFTFFYPLDVLPRWNRIYGPRGFTQYQCVLPEDERPGAAERFLDELTRRGGASFLCVIKDCGAEGEGLLSFPRPGITIAVDLPVRAGTQALVDALNDRVIAEGGRIYLAKDRFTRPEHFRAMEGERLARFLEVKREWDPGGKIRSAQFERLMEGMP